MDLSQIVKFFLGVLLALCLAPHHSQVSGLRDYSYVAQSSIYDTQALLARLGKGPGGPESQPRGTYPERHIPIRRGGHGLTMASRRRQALRHRY